MDEELISIGKMAELNRVSVPTLRLYDEKGLLKPRYTDPQTGYRYYSIDQNARLDMIVYMKELGMSLAQIAQALEKEDISLIEELLSRKNEQIHQQIRQLKAQHDAVERAILSIERYRKSPATGTFSLEYIDRRYAWGAPCTPPPTRWTAGCTPASTSTTTTTRSTTPASCGTTAAKSTTRPPAITSAR